LEVNCDPAAVIGDPQISFRLMGTLYYAGTNLVEACVITAASRSEETRSTCPEPRIPYEEYLVSKNSTLTFSQVSRVGVATGNVYDITSYRVLHNDACYEVALFLHYSDLGVYAPGTVSEFNREQVMDRLKQVFYTFRFTE
jgi:hypothetical protein